MRADFEAYCSLHGLADIEQAFATQYVRHPGSGELVKGHRIVLAELGLVPYAGKAVRSPNLFVGQLAREARAEHLVRRLAFVRAMFAAAQIDRVTLYRGLSCPDGLRPRSCDTFVSATFREDVAVAHFEGRDPRATGLLARRTVAVSRLFMTYLETEAMNARYREAEAVLLFDPSPPF